MSAEIIWLADVRGRRASKEIQQPVEAAVVMAGENPPRFHFWTGASGKRYVHTVYNIFDCPTLEDANYILVRRAETGVRMVLAIGQLSNQSPTLNLAEIRQHASALGADEVHVHLLAASAQEARAVEDDLITAQFTVGVGPRSA
ncbi:MAG TPA: hypothetical protein VM620_09145 [Hyphomicrobium sp.]|jgi:hypothetical protein|nr:hypothetical protein [Hyphomicrobium sp.]